MNNEDPIPVAEYVDDKGNTWQLTAAQAKALGYKAAAQTKVVTPAPTAKRAATTRTK